MTSGVKQRARQYKASQSKFKVCRCECTCLSDLRLGITIRIDISQYRNVLLQRVLRILYYESCTFYHMLQHMSQLRHAGEIKRKNSRKQQGVFPGWYIPMDAEPLGSGRLLVEEQRQSTLSTIIYNTLSEYLLKNEDRNRFNRRSRYVADSPDA